MIVTSVKLQPFAGFSKLTVPFKAGLNVVLGPNESGKSTLVSALNIALFESTKYGKRDWSKELERFIPIQGGDTFQVSLDFSVGADKYQLEKTFGAQDATRLVLPGGQAVVDQVTADEMLNELLEFKRGTWRNVLICEQSTLPNTLSTLSGGGYDTHELADHLRSAVTDSEGISLERMLEITEEKIEAFNSNWDFDRDQPRNNRGLDQPWIQNVGCILKAYYAVAELQEQLDQVENYERSYAEYTQELEKLSANQYRLTTYLNNNAAKHKAAQHVHTREMEWEREKTKLNELKGIQKQWVKAEVTIESKLAFQPALAGQRADLSAELAECQAASANKQKASQLREALELEKKLKAAIKRQNGLNQITDGDLNKLEALVLERQRATDKIAASTLAIKLAVKKKWTGTIEKGLESPKKKTVGAGKSFSFKADGRAIVSSDDWTMTIQSGDVDMVELQRQHDAARTTFTKLLKSHGVIDLKKAKQAAKEFEVSEGAINTLNTQLDIVLRHTTIAKLKEHVGQINTKGKNRKLETVQEEYFTAKYNLQQLKDAIDGLNDNLRGWKARFRSLDQLGDKVADAGIDAREKQRILDEAKRALAGTKNVKAFVEKYDLAKSELNEANRRLYEVKGDRRGLGSPPDMNVSDFQLEIEDLNVTLARLQTEHGALVRIKSAIELIREDQQSDPLQPWIKNLKAVLTELSDGRYESIDVEDGHAKRRDGMAVSYPQLSAGTKSVVGFAVRLSMAEHFLAKTDGFVILDDPLVDLDPQRQEATVRLIKGFAKSKQVIVLTCHPSHAKMFTPNPTKLKRLD